MLAIRPVVVAAGLLTVAAFSTISPATSASAKLFASHAEHKARAGANAALLTYLEINGWLLSTGGCTILIDPILEGALDFGIPTIYSAKRRKLPSSGLCDELPPIDCLLITQGLDDHAHTRTLKRLANVLDGDVAVIAPPSARGPLERSGFGGTTTRTRSRNGNIRYIKPGGQVNIGGDRDGGEVTIKATTGALVGPPWQARENGYIIRSPFGPSIYIEPHVEYNMKELADETPIDAVISPISGQGLPAFELVHGPSDVLRLVQTLQPKYVVPMQNGDVDAEGLASSLVQSIGSPEEFRRILNKAQRPDERKVVEVIDTVPGEDIVLKV
mmetsp:Transcript_25499/g.73746  ORF Transcript_25499/g.73746 Transcript_25499/m.73746 type:complete len:329 (+) Transcript_25499:76-1062(+)